MNADSNLSIGYGPHSGWTESATLDDFNLFNSVLTQPQIAAMYAGGGASGFGSLPATSPVTVNSTATLDISGIQTTIASLADGAGGGTVTNNGAGTTLTLAPAGGSTTFSGVIQDGSGALALTFNGPGATQALTGSNTYSGLTTITAGTLQMAVAAPAARSTAPAAWSTTARWPFIVPGR